MEQLKIRNKATLQHLHNNILPKLATSIHNNLTAITPLFHNFELSIIVDTRTKGPEADADTSISIENGNVQQMGLRLRLEGFQKAGAPPFDVTKDLLFKLGYTSYEVSTGKDIAGEERSYDQNWTKQDMEELAGRWSEELVDDIMQRLADLT
ncbi:hypothetical protein [Pontibacter chitinilyticus]|uniref:hypothetical protein n=1 Tax=Pontibacter chitinilyticus TaxID=2674989 RepID=UPI00321C01DA